MVSSQHSPKQGKHYLSVSGNENKALAASRGSRGLVSGSQGDFPPGYGQFAPLSVLPNICKVVRMQHLILYIQSWKGNSSRKFSPLLKREHTSADLIFKTDLF